MKAAISMDEFEHAKAMRELAAHNARLGHINAKKALLKVEDWRVSKTPEKAPIEKPPGLKKKRVVCDLKTGMAYREYREKLGVEAAAVYTRIGFSKDKFGSYERGNAKWTESIRRRIAEAIHDAHAKLERLAQK